MSDKLDCVVIGAGVIGLAVARALAKAGREVVVLERNGAIGEETSSRNSEVIHGGLYYATGSLKARLCVTGKSLLYAYCERKHVPYRRCGKLIVATEDAQLDRLEAIARQAQANGVDDCRQLDRSALAAREPDVRGAGALISPSTGIVDSHALMQALEADLEAADGFVATRSRVDAMAAADGEIHLQVHSDGDRNEVSATTVVNSAGLDAGRLAARCTGLGDYSPPGIYLAKGNYFIYRGNNPFRSLVYPLPVDGGLGIHATFDLGGRLRFGPDVEWIEEVDYTVDAGRRDAFAEAIRTYWPALRARDLAPDYAGIRPKLSGPGQPAADFRIDMPASGRRRQLVNLFGMESPGLTAALAIAVEVRDLIEAGAG